jgi:hypothetical protein
VYFPFYMGARMVYFPFYMGARMWILQQNYLFAE